MAGTNGAPGGLSGDTQRAFLLAWCCAMGIASLVISINILARLQEAPSEAASAFIDELTSAAALAIAFVLPGLMVLWIRRARPPLPVALVAIGLGFAAFMVVHIGGCVALRALLYPWLIAATYGFDPAGPEMPFEMAKDLIAYAASSAGFAVILAWLPKIRLGARTAPVAATFDIQDGSRLVRTPVGEIIAVQSAGNYAEFQLADGRRLLMRTSLAALQAALEPSGFVRTHRSWLVNSGRVTGLRPEGSGDYAVELGGFEAPVSRRFPAALAALRG